MIQLQAQEREFYADKINGQFHKSQSHYVNLAQRLRESINDESWKEITLASSVEVFKQNNPNKKNRKKRLQRQAPTNIPNAPKNKDQKYQK